MKTVLLLTCEHASNKIPKYYQYLFSNQKTLLASHFGYDIGASSVLNYLANTLPCYAKKAHYSRQLIDLNRSLYHQNLFSSITKTLAKSQQQKIISEYYKPYRKFIENYIDRKIKLNQCILHISIHSFAPYLNEQKRNNDIGLLYDPSRKREKQFCKQFKIVLAKLNSALKVRYNYPYRGRADGLITHLRRTFPLNRYMGIELEINQKHFDNSNQLKLKKAISETLKKLLRDFNSR